MYAPDLVEVIRKDGVKEYYLYPHSRGPGREAMVAKGYSPVGPFTPINMTADGRRTVAGSIMGFDPAVYIEYITDPADPDYEIGFRAYGYWGFQRSFAAQLDQNTMYSLRPGTRIIQHFIPASSSFGVIRDPAGTTYPYVFPDEDLTAFNFFEAASIRKIGNKYIWVYSGYSGPDYGLSSTNSALRYAFGDTPLGPWRSGGVLVDSRAPVPNRNGTALQTSYSGHNTHGSIQEINGQWYVFYHRAPRGFGYARQPMVAPVTITWDEASVADGGRVTINGWCPYAEDNIWRAAAGNHVYNGAEITSEGFQIYGLPPYQYYSAGIACYLSNTGSQASAWDIWNDHAPINNISNGNIIGYKYFGFGGLGENTLRLPPFEGTRQGNNTHFNLFINPKNAAAFTVSVWLDGPWDNETWNGTKIGEIRVPAHSYNTKFSIDVSAFVDHLDRKHAVFLVVEGGGSNLFDLIGLGFSSEANPIHKPYTPVPSIYINGEPIDLPAHPVRSDNRNGITGYNYYGVTVELEDMVNLPVVTASASHEEVLIEILPLNMQPEGQFTTVVRFEYEGAPKYYAVTFVPKSNLAPPVRFDIVRSNPVFEGTARVAWGETIGFLDAGTPPGAVTFTVNVAEAGLYRMNVYHTTPWGAASHNYSINGGAAIRFNYPQGEWLVSEFSEDIELNAGNNTIKVSFGSGITEIRWVELQMHLEEEKEEVPEPTPEPTAAPTATPTTPPTAAPTVTPAVPTQPPMAVPAEEPSSSIAKFIIGGVCAVAVLGVALFIKSRKGKK
jgi:hypothetical protein